MDRIFAFVILIGTLPFFGLVAILLGISLNKWSFFIQKRPGYKQTIFSIYKFKTMRDTRDENGSLLPDFERITPIGKIIRKLSMDELPQLINVLKGEMSFVGPRPLLQEYLPLYSKEQNKRHEVKPGITGWAQVNGRNTLSWQDKFKHDVYYVENQSFFLDLRILIKTVVKVLLPKDINASEQLTMEPFNGKN
jgi:undecaprenyl phosphate N,N'-diacetylbacillosamine 1-phosphate transferase